MQMQTYNKKTTILLASCPTGELDAKSRTTDPIATNSALRAAQLTLFRLHYAGYYFAAMGSVVQPKATMIEYDYGCENYYLRR